MRFDPSDDEIMVDDMLDRALREARDRAPRRDGHAPRPDAEALTGTGAGTAVRIGRAWCMGLSLGLGLGLGLG